jgi:2'-5' RNA ligase
MEVPLRPANRLFAALDLPDDVRAALARRAGRLAAALGGRAVPGDTLHLTLEFLGRVPQDAGPDLVRALADGVQAAGPDPVPAAVAGLRARPSAGRARLCAAELADPVGRLAVVGEAVRAALAGALGRPAPEGRLWPHVTLVRFRRPVRVPATAWADSSGAAAPGAGADVEQVFDFRRAALYDSEVSPGRPPRYRAICQVPVGGA